MGGEREGEDTAWWCLLQPSAVGLNYRASAGRRENRFCRMISSIVTISEINKTNNETSGSGCRLESNTETMKCALEIRNAPITPRRRKSRDQLIAIVILSRSKVVPYARAS